MSEIAVIDSNNYAMMSQMMGMAYDTNDGKNKSTLARLKINRDVIKGQTEMNGKKVSVDIVSSGMFSLTSTNNEIAYANEVIIRTFVQRFMYQRYDSSSKNYIKTVYNDDLKIDLKDNRGGFNCGKPSGYIEDFDALPESTKELVRQTKRVRCILGEVTLVDAIDKDGNDVEIDAVPFVWEVDGKEAFKSIGSAFNTLGKMRRLPVQHVMNVKNDERKLPTGGTYYVPDCSVNVNDVIEITSDDQSLFAEFMGYIESHNKWVLSEWDKNHQEKLDEEDERLVEGFIDLDAEEVEQHEPSC